MNKFSLLINLLSAGILMFVSAISTPTHAASYNIPTVGWLARLQANCDRTECMKMGARALTLNFGSCTSEKDLVGATEIRKSQGFGNDYMVWSEYTLPNGQTCVRTQMPSVEYLNASEAQLLLCASLASEIAFTQSMQNLTPAKNAPEAIEEAENSDSNLVPAASTVFAPNMSGHESIPSQSSTALNKALPYLIIAKGIPAFLDETTILTLSVAVATASKMSSGTVATSNIVWADENDAILGNKPTFTLRGADFATGTHEIAVGNSADQFEDTIEFVVRRTVKSAAAAELP